MSFDIKDKTVVVTGASRGIGRETALALGAMGAEVVLLCRDEGRGNAVKAEVEQKGAKAHLFLADLSSIADVRRVAAEIAAQHPLIHVLINNAGAIFMRREVTVDGIEKTFATNHLAYYLLTELLLPQIEAAAPSRIVNVSSKVHERGEMHWQDLGGSTGYSGMGAYSQSKLANVLYTFALARRLEGKDVTVNALHPGVIGSNFLRSNGGIYKAIMTLASPFLTGEAEGARTTVFLASSPEVDGVTGKYFVKSRVARTATSALDVEAQDRLVRVSAEMTKATAAAAE